MYSQFSFGGGGGVGGISSDIRSEIKFYGDARAEPLYVISERISDDIQVSSPIEKYEYGYSILHFCSLVLNGALQAA